MKQKKITGWLGSAVDELREFKKMPGARRVRFIFAEALLKERIRDTFIGTECIPEDWLIERRLESEMRLNGPAVLL
jgi:hypothetical protein